MSIFKPLPEDPPTFWDGLRALLATCYDRALKTEIVVDHMTLGGVTRYLVQFKHNPESDA